MSYLNLARQAAAQRRGNEFTKLFKAGDVESVIPREKSERSEKSLPEKPTGEKSEKGEISGSGDGRPAHAAALPGPPIIAYRETLRRFWALTAQGAKADAVEVQRTYQEIIRLIDEVGEPRATAERRAWARAWYEETGVCPTCGERGPFHDPGSPQHG